MSADSEHVGRRSLQDGGGCAPSTLSAERVSSFSGTAPAAHRACKALHFALQHRIRIYNFSDCRNVGERDGLRVSSRPISCGSTFNVALS